MHATRSSDWTSVWFVERQLMADGWSSRAAALWSPNLGCTCLPGSRDSHRGESSLASKFIDSDATINNISLAYVPSI